LTTTAPAENPLVGSGVGRRDRAGWSESPRV